MQDLLLDCMEDFRRKASLSTPVAPSDFKELWCSKCNNTDCVNFQTGDPLTRRVATQFERLTNPNQADPNIPKYAKIVIKEWQDMTREALKLEISDRRGDWEIPEIDITDGVPQPAGRGHTNVVDEAVRNLAKAQGKEAPHLPEMSSDPEEFAKAAADLLGELPEPEDEPEPEVKQPAPQHPKKNPAFRPAGRGNAEAQGGMIGGGPVPPPEEPVDPWAVVPSKGGKRVAAGATIKFGAEGEIADD